MKPLFLILVFGLYFPCVFGQMPENELVAPAVSYWGDGIYWAKSHFHFFNGLTYKRHFNRNILRISLVHKQESVQDLYSGDWFYDGNLWAWIVSAGYERPFKIFGQERVVPLLGCSIAFIRSFEEGREGGGFTGGVWDFKRDKFQYGFAPGIGLRFNITGRLFLNLEASAALLWWRSKIYATPVNFNLPDEIHKWKGFDWYLNYWDSVGVGVRF